TALPNPLFVNITNNLVGTDSGDLTTDIRSITLFDNTPATAGDSIPLVGGLGGVFRRLGTTWSEYGPKLPNTVVSDALYVAGADGLLGPGTYGRGAWTVENVSTTVNPPGVLQIDGDTDFAGEDDTSRLVRDAGNPNQLDVFISGTKFGPYELAAL